MVGWENSFLHVIHPHTYTERDIIGLTESSRLVYFAAQADLEDQLTVSRAVLKRWVPSHLVRIHRPFCCTYYNFCLWCLKLNSWSIHCLWVRLSLFTASLTFEPEGLPLNSLGPKFSSQGHFHSLQLLNVPQFLFSRLVRLKTAPRGNFSHA